MCLGYLGHVIAAQDMLIYYIEHVTTHTKSYIVLTLKSSLSPCSETWGEYYIVLYKCNFSHGVVRLDHCVLAVYGRLYRPCHRGSRHANLLHRTCNYSFKIIYSIDPKKLIVPLYGNLGQILYSTIEL